MPLKTWLNEMSSLPPLFIYSISHAWCRLSGSRFVCNDIMINVVFRHCETLKVVGTTIALSVSGRSDETTTLDVFPSIAYEPWT